LIRFFNNIIVIFEKAQNVLNSTLHVVEVMNAKYPERAVSSSWALMRFKKLVVCADSIQTL
jgi:hypothetical protein